MTSNTATLSITKTPYFTGFNDSKTIYVLCTWVLWTKQNYYTADVDIEPLRFTDRQTDTNTKDNRQTDRLR